MQLSEVLTSLSLGVLQNLAVGGSGSGEIPSQYQARVVNSLNQGLVAIYSRFILSEKEVIVRAIETRTVYPLLQIHADSSAAVAEKFISDTVSDPYQQDIIRVLRVYDELGKELLLNSNLEDCVLFTPTMKTLQITKPVEGDTYYVMYQALHQKLTGALDQEIECPIVLNEALESFVAYKLLSSMNGPEHAAKANEHFLRYETICNEVTANDTLLTSINEDTDKLHERGFV